MKENEQEFTRAPINPVDMCCAAKQGEQLLPYRNEMASYEH